MLYNYLARFIHPRAQASKRRRLISGRPGPSKRRRIESLEPRFALAASFTTANFDFGTSSSPLQSGYIRVTDGTKFNTTTGYGWSAGTISSADRATGTAVTRDFNFTPNGTFSVVVPNGMYQVNAQLGDLGSYAHDLVGVFIEGVQQDKVSTTARQVVTRSYQVNVTDGRLDLRLTDLGGSDKNCVIEGMDFKLLTPQVLVGDASITEGDSGQATLTFVATLSSPSTVPVQINFATADGTATAPSDYVANNGTLTIPVGATSGKIEVRVKGDTQIEPDETLNLVLSEPLNAVLSRASAVGTIVNNDFPLTLTVTVPVGPFAENRIEPVMATIDRSGSTASSLTVTLTSDDITEASVPTSITFAAGQSSQTFAIQLVDDSEVDGPQTVLIRASSVGFVAGSATIQVDDNEQPPFFRLFDFATSATALSASGSAKVSAATTYTAARGYGLFGGSAASIDRGGAAIIRDAIYSRDVSFAVDVPNGQYNVDLIMGDTAGYAHDKMGVYLEGTLAGTVSTVGGLVTSRSYQVQVADKQLTLRFRDLGGSDANVVIQALRIYASSSGPSSSVAWPAQPSIPNAVFTGPSVNSDGFINFNVYSQYQRSANTLRVLVPSGYDPTKAYRVIYVLPVEAHEGRQFGDGLLTVRSSGLQNQYNSIFVAPSFTDIPWYADHATNSGIWQETYFKDVVVPFIESKFKTLPGAEGRYLLGFSKSGYGAISMLLRNQDYFGRVIAWDSPLAMSSPSQGYGFSGIVGTSGNFTQNYQITNLLNTRGATLKNQPARIFLLGYATTYGCYADHKAIDAQMTKLGIPHVYNPGKLRSHVWASGWMPEAVKMLLS